MDAAGRRMVAACLVALVCASCASESTRIAVTGTVLTSGASLQAGKRSPVHSFGPDDFVWQLVDFKWADLDRDGGTHSVAWNWYQGDRLVSKSGKYIRFTRSPFTLETHRATATLGTGHFHVETLVDGQLMATSQFDIHA